MSNPIIANETAPRRGATDFGEKKWWKSKTIWGNIAGLIGVVTSPQFGVNLDPEYVATGFGVYNLIMRLLTTKGLVR